MGKADGESSTVDKYSLRNIKGVPRVFGGTWPAKTWHNFMAAALKDVPVTDFNQPAPIQRIADKLNRDARTGIDPGDRRNPAPTGAGGPYIVGPAPPAAESPGPTTSTTSPPVTKPPTSSTTTTALADTPRP